MLDLDPAEVKRPGGLEISVQGFKGDSSVRPSQVFIEIYEGKLRVHVWDGSKEDPVQSIEIDPT